MALNALRIFRIVSTLCVFLACAGVAVADQAVDAGRSRGRALVMFRAPNGCAMPLLNARCRADAQTFFDGRTDADMQRIPGIGAHPISGLTAFLEDGDRSSFDPALAYLNATQAPSSMWASDSGGAARFDGAVLSVLWPAARGNVLAEYLSVSPLLDLYDHRKSLPENYVPSIPLALPSGARSMTTGQPTIPMQTIASAGQFVTDFDAIYPAPAWKVAYPSGLRGDAVFGSVFQTVMQLIDNPVSLGQPENFAFADAALDQLTARSSHAAAIDSCRVAIDDEANGHARTPPEVNGICEESFNDYISGLPAARRRAFALGAFATQLSYNAAIFHSAETASRMLATIRDVDELDSVLRAFARDRSAARTVADTDWQAQFHLGLKLTSDIMTAP